MALWTSANGVSWKPSQSSGLNGSGAWQIDALAPSGAAVAGIGTIVTQQSQQTVTFTLPPVKGRSPCAPPTWTWTWNRKTGTEDIEPGARPAGGSRPAADGGRAPGVAWGHAERHPAAR